nr:hypothetical protein CFP56_59344 [Quercus suber]
MAKASVNKAGIGCKRACGGSGYLRLVASDGSQSSLGASFSVSASSSSTAVEILNSDIVPAPSGYQQGSSKEHDRLEDDLKLTGATQNFGEGTRVENERVQKGVAKGRSCSSAFRNDGGEEELELTGFEVVG